MVIEISGKRPKWQLFITQKEFAMIVGNFKESKRGPADVMA
jgi:hypothetical protein